jgi:tRNA 2-thiouridine synthesizing protein A
MVTEYKADRVLDVKGLTCPYPVLKTKKLMDQMKPGEILEVIATDDGCKTDLPAWAKRTGNEFLGMFENTNFTRFFIKKK